VQSVTERNDFVLVERPRRNVALVTLNRPERMNSMAFDVMVPLKAVLDELTYDNSVRAVVLTGAGRGFSSGADHKSAGSVPHIEGLTRPTFALRSMQVLDDVILGLRRMHQPVIAAVNGAAIGGGLCLALAADIRVAAEGAYFRAAGINNGLTASELGLSYLLPRAIGTSRAFELMLTGRDVGADEAERIGLVSRRVPGDQLLDTCYDMAERIAGFSRPGIELTKRTLWTGLDAASLEGHMQAEGLGQLFVRLLTANFEEAVAARAEKRSPEFTDERSREEATSTDERSREEATSTDERSREEATSTDDK
jgi:enoyl-CoA hydratase